MGLEILIFSVLIGCFLTGCADKSLTQSLLELSYQDFDPCASTGLNLPPGLTTITEDFNQAAGPAGFDADRRSCWRNHQDAFRGKIKSDYTTTFAQESINGISVNTRKLGIAFNSEFATNTTTTYSPYSLPATGFDSGLFPYNLDLFKAPECFSDVSFKVALKPATTGGAAVYGLLINTKVTGVGSRRNITGYLIHLNGGGNSYTLVKFDRAFDHALDYLDHFPGSFGNPNPTIDGPYKGWDFKVGAAAAGGSPNNDSEVVVVTRYRYNTASSTVTLEWEVRPASGIDGSPGTYDFSRTLTGADALAPGGGYGVYVTMYGGIANPGDQNDLFIGPARLDCMN